MALVNCLLPMTASEINVFAVPSLPLGMYCAGDNHCFEMGR